MGDSKDRVDLIDESAKSGAKKLGEKAVDRALNALADFIKKKYGESQVKLGTVFEKYLENATLRYNQVRTLVTGQTPRKIVGEDSVYVNIGLRYGKEVIDTSIVDHILQISQNILISGTGGCGKTMLMRYLFLNTADRGEYVPVLIDLRRINNQPSGKRSILDLIYLCMQDFNVKLHKEQFNYSLELGKYLFLFDGLDEVKASLSAETAEGLQSFSAKYPNNPCIITSRPKDELSLLETFTTMEPMTLNKRQALQMVKRIRAGDEKTQEFCKQLDKILYDKHIDFAENPLLLSMMFLTFIRNMSIPEHLSDFYQKAYDALYSIHDSNDKGSFRRDFHSKIDEEGFKRLFSHFCFHTYMKEIYEFSKSDILLRLNTSIQKLGISNARAEDYLKDLRNAVCMIIKDGDIYRFAHRSFQTYFAAYYTSHHLTDEQQKRLFKSILSGHNSYWTKQDYYNLMVQIEPERFAANALEDGLRTLVKAAKNSLHPEKYVLKSIYNGFGFERFENADKSKVDKGVVRVLAEERFFYNIIHLSSNYTRSVRNNWFHDEYSSAKNKHYICLIEEVLKRNFSSSDYEYTTTHYLLLFETIDHSDSMPEIERKAVYDLLIELEGIDEEYKTIVRWLSELDKKRASLQEPNFIDDL